MNKNRKPKMPEDFYYLKGFLWGLNKRLKSMFKTYGDFMINRLEMEDLIKDIDLILSNWEKQP